MGIKTELGMPPDLWDDDFVGALRVHLPGRLETVNGSIAILGNKGDLAAQLALAERIRNLLALEDACLAKLEVGEPFFVMRGKDILSAGFVKRWADQAADVGATPEKVAEARATAKAMLTYPGRRMPT